MYDVRRRMKKEILIVSLFFGILLVSGCLGKSAQECEEEYEDCSDECYYVFSGYEGSYYDGCMVDCRYDLGNC